MLSIEVAYRLAIGSLQPLPTVNQYTQLDPRVARAIWASETGSLNQRIRPLYPWTLFSREKPGTAFARAIAIDFLWEARKRGRVSSDLESFLKGAAVTAWVTRSMSTDEIVARYAELMWIARAERGLEAGAQYWYGRPVAAVDDVQLAVLLGVSQSAARYYALRHPEGALALRNRVLERFVAAGFMASSALSAAKAAPLDVACECPKGDAAEQGVEADEARQTSELRSLTPVFGRLEWRASEGSVLR